MAFFRAILIFLIITTGLSMSTSYANKTVLKKVHRSMQIISIELPKKHDGISLLPPEDGIVKLTKAVDLLYAHSPVSAANLELLKDNGSVTIVYDPNFPKRQFSSVTIAAFFPDFFQKEKGGMKQFLVVVGRFGIKWPLEKLATVIAHELVGHGLQHFLGHRGRDRKIDLECEALIYEILAQQDLRIRRDTNDMIRLRRDVRRKWCADFSRYMTKAGINVDKAWGYGRPDVKVLLSHFSDYRKHLRNTGVSGRAVAAAKAKRIDDFAAFKLEAEKTASATKMLIIAQRYLKGIGIDKDIRKGAIWAEKSAQLKHPPAQHLIGILRAAGHGVTQDPIEAYAWLTAAVNKGYQKAKIPLKQLHSKMSATERTEGRTRALNR